MRILIVSDSHGNTPALSRLADKFGSKVDFFIHLGDDSIDAKIIEDKELRVVKVPGVFEGIYNDPERENRLLCEYCGKKILLTHTRERHSNDILGRPGPEELAQNADVIFYGHTHIAKIEIDTRGVPWINPGHMKEGDDRGRPMSYAIIECTNQKFEVKIYRYENDSIWMKYP